MLERRSLRRRKALGVAGRGEAVRSSSVLGRDEEIYTCLLIHAAEADAKTVQGYLIGQRAAGRMGSEEIHGRQWSPPIVCPRILGIA